MLNRRRLEPESESPVVATRSLSAAERLEQIEYAMMKWTSKPGDN